MIRLGDKDYKMLFLDTNIIREITMDKNDIRRKFFNRFFIESNDYAPCFSIYNLIELKPYEDIYNSFVNYFSALPCILIFPYKIILEHEHNAFVNKSKFEFTEELIYPLLPEAVDSSRSLVTFSRRMWNDEIYCKINKREVDGLSEVAEEWTKNRADSEILIKKMGYPEDMISDGFYRNNEKDTMIKDLKNHDIFVDSDFNYKKYPGCRIMEYSQFSRVYMTKKDIKRNDVMDVKLSCVIPYVDAVVTEAYQAEVLKKSRGFISQMKGIELYRIKDI